MSAAALTKPAFAVIAEFSSATTLYEAAEKVRDAGFRFWDVHSPFPIHGMNKAMGLGKSPSGIYYLLWWVPRVYHRCLARIHSLLVALSVDRSREAGQFFYGSAFFPDHV